VGVAQPILDLYGKNATVFTAAKLGRGAIIEFALLVAFAAPLAWVVVSVTLRRAPRAFRAWTALPVGAGVAGAWLVVARQHAVTGFVSVPLAAALCAGCVVAYVRLAPLRTVAALMGLLAPVTVVLFLSTSSAARVAWGQPSSPVAIPPSRLAHRPTIVWLVFDETNLPMLLDRDGAIDAIRYPNLAGLVGSATWYRNAIGIDNLTPRAVPGMLASRDGSGTAWPTPADYPVNAFSLLADSYRIDAYEPVTDLCAAPSCLSNMDTGSRSLRSVFDDAAVVYGTMVLPGVLARRLPAITHVWGGFGSQAGTAQSRATLAKFRRFNRGPSQQLSVADEAVSRIVRGEAPTLHFVHLLLPHRPWQLLPDETAYDDADASVQPLAGVQRDAWLAHDLAARFALQAAAADAVVGRVVARLRSEGLWDSALLVVTADHGVNFTPGTSARVARAGDELDELYRVPLLIRLPGQAAGGVSNVPASTADILPTLLSALGAPPLSQAAGVDLAGQVPASRHRTVWRAGVGRPFDAASLTVSARVRDYATWFDDARTGWDRIFARGPYRNLIGTRVPATAARAEGYRAEVVLPRSERAVDGQSVSLVLARLATPRGRPVADGAIVVASGGVVVGFLGGAGGASGPGVRVEGLVDWRTAGRTAGLAFYLATGPTAAPTLQEIARSPAAAIAP
jgi:hypothetical protein